MIAALTLALTASALRFNGFVPPHRAADGVRYRVEAAASVDLPAEMTACGIEGVEQVQAPAGDVTYQFAVTRSTDALAQCLRGRLARGARMDKIDNWITDAKAD